MKKYLPYLDIMIQYTCNLSCRGCITMTDYMRKGSVSIEEGKVWLEEWSQKLDIDTVCLFGGEPLMNKDITSWIRQTRKYFPQSKIKIITNGTYLKNKNILAELFAAGNIEYQVSLHWREGQRFDSVKTELLRQMQKYESWTRVKSDRKEILYAFTHGAVTVQLALFGEFVQSYQGHGTTMKPWASDDIVASYSNCGSPRNPILYKNKIYKCGPIANLRDTLELHNLLDTPVWQEYLNYNGFNANDDLTELVNNFDKPNAICSMCSKNKIDAEIDHYAPNNVMEKKEIIWQN